MPPSPVTSSATDKTMKSLIALTFTIIFGWLAVVTFFGPELARAVNAPEAKKPAKHSTKRIK